MQWPVYKTFSMESFGVEPVQEIGEEELCFEARKTQWFEARSRWVKVEESRLRVENELVSIGLLSMSGGSRAAATAAAILIGLLSISGGSRAAATAAAAAVTAAGLAGMEPPLPPPVPP
jgi:hypothetical protein